jgi:hypothetical protein
VESDSSDGTIEVLDSLKSKYQNFDYATLGKLDESIPVREDRISFCRNKYLAELRTNQDYKDIEFLAVADLDGINDSLDTIAIESCFEISDWAGCFSNQVKYYYDIYALRHPAWSPDNCWKYEAELRKSGVPHVLAREMAVYSRQRKIAPHADWVEVDSAFGGFGIYDVNQIGDSTYSARDFGGEITCEHVIFHQKIRAMGGKLYINPKLINSRKNPHTDNRLPFNRLKWLIKLFLARISIKFASKPI